MGGGFEKGRVYFHSQMVSGLTHPLPASDDACASFLGIAAHVSKIGNER